MILKSKILQLLSYLILFTNCSQIAILKKPDHDPNKNIQESFFTNGNLEYRAEFLNGKLDGTTKVWHEDGHLFSVSEYSNGLPNGKWKKFYASGNLLFEENYIFGKKDGFERWYYENGNIKSEQHFTDDKEDSNIIRWDLDGNIIYY